MIVASTMDCSRSVGHPDYHSLCIDLVRPVPPPAPGGFLGWPSVQVLVRCETPLPCSKKWYYVQGCRRPPLFLSKTPLFNSQESSTDHAVLNNSYNSRSSRERNMSQYPTYENSNCFNNKNSFNNVWNNCTIADDRSPLLAWLSPLEPKLRHGDIQERRADDVGEWFLQTEAFRYWCDWSGEGEGQNAVLFCYGDPGIGKTFIR